MVMVMVVVVVVGGAVRPGWWPPALQPPAHTCTRMHSDAHNTRLVYYCTSDSWQVFYRPAAAPISETFSVLEQGVELAKCSPARPRLAVVLPVWAWWGVISIGNTNTRGDGLSAPVTHPPTPLHYCTPATPLQCGCSLVRLILGDSGRGA